VYINKDIGDSRSQVEIARLFFLHGIRANLYIQQFDEFFRRSHHELVHHVFNTHQSPHHLRSLHTQCPDQREADQIQLPLVECSSHATASGCVASRPPNRRREGTGARDYYYGRRQTCQAS
jgi:hypothetical protein